MTEKPATEEYVYYIGKIRFIVTPVYKETGELMRDILLKLMLAQQRARSQICGRNSTRSGGDPPPVSPLFSPPFPGC